MSSTAPPISPDWEFVAVDLETTGGDAQRDRIIEIGAARFAGGKVVETFATFVNPGRPLPPFITRLTGITEAMVEDAPPAAEAVSHLTAFIAGRPLVAHNARFEAQFLAQQGLRGYFFDSLFWYELAQPLGRHNLRAAAEDLNEESEHHRALPDAILCGKLFLVAQRELASLEPDLLSSLAAVAQGSTDPDLALLASFAAPDLRWRRTEPPPRLPRWHGDVPDLRHWVEAERLEAREGQLRLSEAVAEAFADETVLVAEAGTGIGKSLAYLLPGLAAAAGGEHLVVSTYTKTLQDQILHKELARLSQRLGPIPVLALKGQRNYLCLRRFTDRLQMVVATGSVEERKDYLRLLRWVAETETGDQGEVHVARETWAAVEVRKESCTHEDCPFYRVCFYFAARRMAAEAPVVILNHALMLQEAKAEDSFLDGALLVVDEAHELEGAATGALTESVGDEDVQRLLAEVRARPGEDAATEVAAAQDATARFRQAVLAFGARRLTAQRLEEPATVRLLEAAQDLAAALTDLALHLRADEAADPERQGMAEMLSEKAKLLLAFGELDRDIVLWTEVEDRTGHVRCLRAPITPGPFLRQFLWTRPKAAVLTSATLTIADSFEHLLTSVGLDGDERTVTRVYPSPFHYREQALLGLLRGLPDPQEEEAWFEAVAKATSALISAAGGRTLVLFTSHRQLRETAQRVRDDLQQQGITLLAQGIDGPRRRIMEALRAGDGPVAVFGAQSFWEGVDVVGPRLKLVIIVRLPFRPPDEPVLAARMERLQEEGRSPFFSLQLPEAVLRLKQGFGRLIRSSEDTGAVVVLDPRLLTARYGRVFLASLPDASVLRAELPEMLAAVRSFTEVGA